ncbi:tRNA pseudouridine(55) synthase TruB [Anaerolineales bacterium HSG6]|nr:tRNA pseudouridine(55) synthase TruB [Anaerolineales bacterium HSG6]MDM8533005.1 tRNA pseudouridine(55) synthase TruB [Anaerolineales bacterium HSG25]
MTANPLSGLFIIDKPQGMTSHDVVQRVRRLTGQRKTGHSGTLDPMATGVLLVCLGQATRIIEYLMTGRKTYQATIRFGVTTDTLDADGQITSQKDSSTLTATEITQVLPRFQGLIEQIPPIYSALKKDGQPLYKRARAGEVVTVDPRPVTIYNIEWDSWSAPDLTITVTCSAGTYIRSLARDIGEAVEVGAHLVGLIRTDNGTCRLSDAVTLEQLEIDWRTHLLPIDHAITHIPKIILNNTDYEHVQHGRKITLLFDQHKLTMVNVRSMLRAYTPSGQFLAILTPVQEVENLWRPKKVFKTDSHVVL